MAIPVPKSEMRKYYTNYINSKLITGKDGKDYVVDITELSSAKLVEKAAKGIKGVSYDNPAGAVWFLLYNDRDLLVGSVCCVVKRQQARFKSDFLLESTRGQGLYTQLSKLRMEYAYLRGCSQATCYSTVFSRSQFLKDNFAVESERNGIAYMRKIL